ncbi:unnamed protein product [Toxocara canis]|uniref:Uncharacterized protein n=1 Tax=Toxocara canis TaxID=6265 RepID=A0A183UMJ4_TOXCA|nr:unnamed protein product [Toxocara canis]
MSCCWTARSIGGGQHDELLVDSTTSCGWSPRWITGGQLDELLVDSAMKSSWTARRAAGGRHHELLVDSTMSCWWILLVIIERQQIALLHFNLGFGEYFGLIQSMDFWVMYRVGVADYCWGAAVWLARPFHWA